MRQSAHYIVLVWTAILSETVALKEREKAHSTRREAKRSSSFEPKLIDGVEKRGARSDVAAFWGHRESRAHGNSQPDTSATSPAPWYADEQVKN